MLPKQLYFFHGRISTVYLFGQPALVAGPVFLLAIAIGFENND